MLTKTVKSLNYIIEAKREFHHFKVENGKHNLL